MSDTDKMAEELARNLAIRLSAKNGFSYRIGDCDNPINAKEAEWIAKDIAEFMRLKELLAIVEALRTSVNALQRVASITDETRLGWALKAADEALAAYDKK